MAEVVFERVNKVYDNGFHAVHDLNLTVADGECLVLVGPSGCGKSTALRMIAGIEDITSGVMRIGDRVVNAVPSKDRDIAMVFQSYALYPHMTVAENIGYGLRIRKTPKEEKDRLVREAAAKLDLLEYLDRRPKQLSGGQRQRVAMGRAIVRRPQVFLMDEPLSNLDAKLRGQMRAEISAIQHELGVTTLYVTHDQVEAMTMGDRVALMKRGVLQQVAEPQYLYENPANLFVAGFIGSPPMNMALGSIHSTPTGLQLRMGSQTLELDPQVRSSRPGLEEFVGREVVAGIRSEDMEDGILADPSDTNRLKAKVQLVESLGSEVMVHFSVDAPPPHNEDTELLAKEQGADEVGHVGFQGETRWVASFSPRTRVRLGELIDVVVDTKRLHFFDPATGQSIVS